MCVHAYGSTVLPLLACTVLPQHPTLPAVPWHQPAPPWEPWEAALHCRHQWTLVMRVCIFSNWTLLRCDVGSKAICTYVVCMCVCVHVCVS